MSKQGALSGMVLCGLVLIFWLPCCPLGAENSAFQESFEDAILPPGWRVDTPSGNAWRVARSRHNACDGMFALMCKGIKQARADAWCYTAAFPLLPGKQYVLRFAVKVKVSFSAEDLRVVLYGPEGTETARELYANPTVSDSICRFVEREFSVSVSGRYRLGLHYGSRDGKKLFVDAIEVKEVLPLRVMPLTIAYDTSTPYISLSLTNHTDHAFPVSLSQQDDRHSLLLPQAGVVLGPGQHKVLKISCRNQAIAGWVIRDALLLRSANDQVNARVRLFLYGNHWQDLSASAPLPFADYAIGAATDGNSIYAFAGYAGSSAARFDLQSGEWHKLTPPPDERPEPYSAVYYQGACYFMSSSSNRLYRYTYNAAGGTYQAIAGPSAFTGDVHFRRPCLAVFGSTLFVLGHVNSPGPYDIQFWQYDIPGGCWQKLPLPPVPPLLTGMAAKNGNLYVLGGRNRRYKDISRGAVYHIADRTWREAPYPAIPGGSGYPGVLLRIGGYLFFDRGRMANQVFLFKLDDPQWREWLELQAKPTFNFYAGAVAAGGRLYMMGGTRDVPLSANSVRDVCYVMSHDALIADAGPGDTVPPEGSIRLGAHTVASGGTPPYRYAWSDGAGWSSELEYPAYPAAGKTVTITLTVTDSAGHRDTDRAVYFR